MFSYTNILVITATGGLDRVELGIFTSLKPCSEGVGKLQARSLSNWSSVFGNVDFVEFDGPLIPFGEMVVAVEQDINADILMYANADILFDKLQVASLWRRLMSRLPNELTGDFLATGQRVDILEKGNKRLHRPSGMDYFIFRRGMFHDLPRTLMGRAYCDNALVSYCLRRSIPVIDVSFALCVEHQFHDYRHVMGGKETVWRGADAIANKQNNSLREFGPNVLDATHTLLSDGRIVPNIRKRPPCWKIWNFLTRGGKYWKNPQWDGVDPI